MESLTLYEYETRPAVRLTPEQRDTLRRLNAVSLAPSLGREGSYDLTPGSLVGAIGLPGLAIEIRPKVEIDRLLFLLSYTLDPRHWRSSGFDFIVRESLVEALARPFLYQVRNAFRRGILQGYRAEEEALAGVRGRIRLEDQIRRRFGLVPPVEVRYDDLTEDIEANRLIRAAAARLERMRLRSSDVRSTLRWVHMSLERVTLCEYRGGELPEIIWNRLNERYRGAVELAKLILRGSSFDLGHGEFRTTSFLLEMSSVFEDFVSVALREALGLSPGVFPRGARERSLWLDRARTIRLKPDLSWWQGPDCVFVGDIKYKRIRHDGVLHPDLYQLLAYTIATGLPSGTLIYAAGEREPVIHEVVDLGKRLEVTTLDLSREPSEILSQVAELAKRLRQSAGTVQTQRAAGTA